MCYNNFGKICQDKKELGYVYTNNLVYGIPNNKYGGPKPTPKPTPTPSTDKVYWTETGSRYHKTEKCVTLKNAKRIFSGSLENGKLNGRTPCKVCW
ncbi:hypothetical protein [Acutalibacter sp. 1XD8-36]|uniref:hypothetical protein n=1 Tax=Acutalibacter sp. 1XD8-36 TaxID=2320852 RepID=UPI002639D9F5|nr:hypothetical protein [Acutalibacter sp. 1XD8-36]